MKPIIVHITNSSKEEAKRVSTHLLEKRLVACASIYLVESLYWWEGKIAEEMEYAIDAKTTEDKFEEIVSAVGILHSYTIPCILKIPMDANKKYKDWMEEEMGK